MSSLIRKLNMTLYILSTLVLLITSLESNVYAVEVTYDHRPLYVAAGTQLEPRISGDRVVFTDLSAFLGDIYVVDVNTVMKGDVHNIIS